jgi:serine/threonine protein kinase/WD40 repeat protein
VVTKPGAGVAFDETAAPNAATSDTIDASSPPHAPTLPGPFKVADLPTLPRVDDSSYSIGDEIARGGMGKILAARDRRLRRDVVIKVMRRDSGLIDPRFEREALITARLQHPSIVRVYDAGVLGDGRAFYAMERVRGRSLEVVLAESNTLRARLALLPHAIAVCDALAYAHNEGVVHRDLKPSNVLLGPFGETVVIDWGLAKDRHATDDMSDAPPADSDTSSSSSSALTQHGAVMGTPSYMAPEQARGEVADERTDVYALGALLYTMLTGAPPVSGTSSDEVIGAVAAGRRKRITEVEPSLPPELASIVERAMAHDPGARYDNAKQLADDLRSFAAGKLVPSHDYSTWQLVRRWIARNRVPVGIAAFALAVIVTVTVMYVRNLDEERRAALDERNVATAMMQVAEEKTDTIRLEQAEKILPHDPSTALAWLKQLRNVMLSSERTLAIANKARDMGTAFELSGHDQDVEVVVASPDGTHAATGSDDTTIRWWDLAKHTSVVFAGHKSPIEALAMSSDGVYLASAGTDHLVILWNVADGSRRELAGHNQTVRGVAFSADNSKLASTAEDGTLFVWDVASGAGTQLLADTHSLRPLVWVDANDVLVGTFDGRIGRVDVTTKHVTWTRDPKHGAELRSLAVTPDGTYIVASDEDGAVTLWDARTLRHLRDLSAHIDVAREVIITGDGKHVVSCGGDNEVHVTSIPDGALVVLDGNQAGIKDIDVSHDGLVASAGIDGVVRVWKLDGTLVHTFRGHGAAVKGVTFAGRLVVSGAEDHQVRLWSLDPPPPPPRGTQLRHWLDAQTNIAITK